MMIVIPFGIHRWVSADDELFAWSRELYVLRDGLGEALRVTRQALAAGVPAEPATSDLPVLLSLLRRTDVPREGLRPCRGHPARVYACDS
jgi:hypothetical protein